MTEIYCRHALTVTTEGEPLYVLVADALPGLARNKARLAISAGLVQVDGALASDPQKTVAAGSHDLVVDLAQGIPNRGAQRAHRRDGGSAAVVERPFAVLFEDDQIIVVDKASGILSAPADSDSHGHIPELLRNYWRSKKSGHRFIGVVHRIDQPTSGCLVVARTQEAQRILQTQFASHSAGRRYRCLVAGGPRQDQDTLNGKIGRGLDGRRSVVDETRPGKDAITHFTVRERYATGADVEVWLETGRTHQIRVHMAGIGCPVLGDPLYGMRGKRGKPADGIPRAPRLMLHAWQVAFDHPRSGERIEVEAPVPPVFAQVAKGL
ncbi:MAG: RluA family pseudouridine synthase [Planctomycetota bacterium]|jgi:23S rRNA pseudouridine1911/1915/1917 synthase|nr:RluA family pseudouridine synthase [Planctomycetota bacterium]